MLRREPAAAERQQPDRCAASVYIAVLLEPHQLAMLLELAVDRLAVFVEELARNNEGAA